MIATWWYIGRGALKLHRRCTATYAGAISKENVGISNDKQGEKPCRRKSKGS
jgi:hypothetical protein